MSVEASPSPAEIGTLLDLEQLTPRARRQLAGDAEGTPWMTGDRLFTDWKSGDVFDLGEPNAEGIGDMLDVDGTARQLEQVLSLPLRAAPITLVGGTERGRRLVREQVPEQLMTMVFGQMTSAIAYRKAFFELTWRQDGRQVLLDGASFRPARSCQAAFDRKGRPIGFRQRIANPQLLTAEEWAKAYGGEQPGWARIPKQRALIYTHGTHREPLKGISDLSVAWWAYETRKKLLFLWLQFLELQSQPKVLVYGKDMAQAKRNMTSIAQLVAGGYAPAERPDDPQAKAFDILETAGRGAELYESAVRYLESHMTDSVLAGFTKLSTGAAVGNAGSRALSTDASAFFRDGRQAVADEESAQAKVQLFAPICIYNGLTPADVPTARIGPLSKEHMSTALGMVEKLVTAPTVNAPPEFLQGLLTVVAPLLGLDAEKLGDAITRRAAEQAEQQADQAIASGFGGETGDAAGPPPTRPRPGAPDQQGAELAHAVDSTTWIYRRARELGDADAALAEYRGARPVSTSHIDLASPTSSAAAVSGDGGGGDQKDKPAEEHTGGMICLVPDAETAQALRIEGGEPLEELHLTLAFLGDDVTGWDDDTRSRALDAGREVAGDLNALLDGAPLEARAFAHTTFNADRGPDGDRDPCAVYGIGDSEFLAGAHEATLDALHSRNVAYPRQHTPWVPHVTAGYGKTGADLRFLGPVKFDRVAVVIGGDWAYLPLDDDSH